MSIGRIILIATVISVVGLIVLPSTINIFAGGHTYYDVSKGNESSCPKCHADVMEELKVNTVHNTVDGKAGVSGEECRICHRANVSSSEGTHAATVTSCRYCHLNASGIVGAPLAGGFGLSGLKNDTGIYEVHASYVYYSGQSKLLPNTTEACIGCHSNIGIKVDLKVSTGAKFVAYNNHSANQSYWDTNMKMTNFTTYQEVVE